MYEGTRGMNTMSSFLENGKVHDVYLDIFRNNLNILMEIKVVR